MNNNEEVAQQMCDEENSSENIEINNQLGLPGIFDEITPINVDVDMPKEAPQRSPEVAETGAGGLSQDMQGGGLDKILLMLQQMQQNNEVQNQKIQEKIEAQTKSLKAELREFREENLKMHQETREELRKTEKELRTEMQQIREELKAETKIVKEDGEKTRQEMEENKEAIKSLRGEVNKNRQQLTTNTNNLSDNLNRINSELRSEVRLTSEETTKVKKNQEEIEEHVKRLEEEKKRRIDEIKKNQDQLTRRINEVEGRPLNRVTATDVCKDVNFNGSDCYPMEFLKEIKEIKQLYYTDDDVKWIAKHLSEEAMTWWRIVKYDIHNFAEFEHQFINKYWSSNIQQSVRDRLEYGRYRSNGNLSAVQYVQKQILQGRELMPPITDQHLIKKLARHFSREIEVAVLLRSIRDITQFENLLQDFEKINDGLERQRFTQPTVKREAIIETEPTKFVNNDKWKKGKFNPKSTNNAQRGLDVIDAQPSTSTAAVTKNGLTITRTQ